MVLVAALVLATACGDDDSERDAAVDATPPDDDVMVMCPPCVSPPDEACLGSGPCGCGPYTCPMACGTITCGPTEYCRFTPGSGVFADDLVCDRLPGACDGQRSCACLASEPCGDACADDGTGNPRLTCPGPG
jgi:hypothetical protein